MRFWEIYFFRRGGKAKIVARLIKKIHFIPHPVFSSQSAGSVDLTEIMLASHRATLHDFMALS
jgi:hypothetical protein